MEKTHRANTTSVARPAADRPRAWTANLPPTRPPPHAATAWPHVHVEAVEILPPTDPRHRGRLVVRACVHLGTLLPADVHVELATRGPEVTDQRAPTMGYRLWSVQSYGNGCFLFEALVPESGLGSLQDCAVRLTPAWTRSGPWTAAPVIRGIAAPPVPLPGGPERVTPPAADCRDGVVAPAPRVLVRGGQPR